MSNPYTIALFSYSTLQLEAAQIETFARLLRGRADAMLGFKKEMLEITDPDAVKLSGERVHPVVSASTNPAGEVASKVFRISGEDLAAADSYEVSDCKRIEVSQKSSGQAWVYLNA